MFFQEREFLLPVGLTGEQLPDRPQPVGAVGERGLAGVFQGLAVVFGGQRPMALTLLIFLQEWIVWHEICASETSWVFDCQIVMEVRSYVEGC